LKDSSSDWGGGCGNWWFDLGYKKEKETTRNRRVKKKGVAEVEK
jgi:hypothetical protein